MSHTANTRPLAIRIPAHYSWMKMRSGEYPFRALGNCPAGDSFRSLKICLQQLPVDCCAFFPHHVGGFSGCCSVTAIVRKTGYIRYNTEQCTTRLPAAQVQGFFSCKGKQWLTNYIYNQKCACTVGENNLVFIR